MTIGALSRATEIKIPTIRFYEQIGLLEEPQRTPSNRRVYGPDAVRRLVFIGRARQLGFAVDAVRDLLRVVDRDQPCGAATAIAEHQLAAVEAKIEQLGKLRSVLHDLVAAQCSGRSTECPVLDALIELPMPRS